MGWWEELAKVKIKVKVSQLKEWACVRGVRTVAVLRLKENMRACGFVDDGSQGHITLCRSEGDDAEDEIVEGDICWVSSTLLTAGTDTML